jgi:hypothetical protein
MNHQTRERTPQNTNNTGTRGRGERNPSILGRQTIVNEITARVDSSLGSIFRPANPPGGRDPQSVETPPLETSFSSRAEAEIESEDLSSTNQQATLENIEDQGSIA